MGIIADKPRENFIGMRRGLLVILPHERRSKMVCANIRRYE